MTGLDRLHEIAEDVGRTAWLRELGAVLSETADAIEGGMRDPSGYESDVLAWVEKNGGLDAVKERTMPEGMEWPMFEDGEPVRIGEHWQQDEYDWSITSIDSIEFAEDGVRFENEYADAFYRYGERVKRPAPPVLDADGVEIRVGDEVWSVNSGMRYTVEKVAGESICIECRSEIGTKASLFPLLLTHRAPVFAADGKPLEVGQTVWEVDTEVADSMTVVDVAHDLTRCEYTCSGGKVYRPCLPPERLTHQRPVLDADGVPIKKGDTVYWLEHTAPFTVVSPHETRDNAGQELKCGHTVEVMRDGHEPHMYVHPESLHHAKPEPPKCCRDCAHWQKDPIADKMGVCWFFYHEHEGQDCYPARLGDIGACEEFMPRASALAERERGE